MPAPPARRLRLPFCGHLESFFDSRLCACNHSRRRVQVHPPDGLFSSTCPLRRTSISVGFLADNADGYATSLGGQDGGDRPCLLGRPLRCQKRGPTPFCSLTLPSRGGLRGRAYSPHFIREASSVVRSSFPWSRPPTRTEVKSRTFCSFLQAPSHQPLHERRNERLLVTLW